MTRPPPAWLSSGPVARLLALLDGGGEEARAVGGAVRDWLAGLAAGDIDLATTAHPDTVTARAAAAGFKVVPTGIVHGTVTVVVDGAPVEVTTLREDIATDGRRAVVRFGRDWRADAARRDFSVNAMSLGRDGVLHDYFGGAADLAAGRIRFIGEAAQRIREDRLRILRFFRFHARFGRGAPDAAGLAACIAERRGLADLSRERMRAELLKLVVAPRAEETAAAMTEAGLLGAVLGGVALWSDLGRLARIEQDQALAPDAVRRLAALAVLVREDAERLRERLALSNAEFRRLEGIGEGWAALRPGAGEGPAKALLQAVGPRNYLDRALVAFARSAAREDDEAWRGLLGLPERWHAPAFPVSGQDLMARGLEPGPAMGAALGAVRKAWVEAGFPLSRSDVDRLLDRVLGARR